MKIKKMNEDNKEKNKFINSTLIISSLICLLPIIAGIYFYNQLPENLATHFNLNGQADNWTPKWVTLFILPVFFSVLNIIENIASRFKKMPKQLIAVMTWIIPIICTIVYIMTFYFNMKGNFPFDIINLVSVVIGFIFIIVGNYIPKSPLESINLPELSGIPNIEEVNARYKKMTVRYMGRNMFISGSILLVSCFTPINKIVFFVVIFGNLISTPVIIMITQHKIYKGN